MTTAKSNNNYKKTNRSYGWRPDIPDCRDIAFSATYKISPALPRYVDLREMCPEIEDQGKLGSCTAHALTGALEFLEKKDGLKVIQMSRLFVYYNERAMEHSIESDSGAMIRDGIKTLAKKGVCVERKWPYVIDKFAIKPTVDCYAEALEHQILSYQRIETLDQMRSCLADGFPFVFGFSVYESFESEEVAKTGTAEMPSPNERCLGGHAVLAVGYDDTTKRFIVRNSWGRAWGMKGYFTLPFAYADSRNLSDDFWTIRRGEKM